MIVTCIYNRLEAHEDINNDFYKYYKWIEFNLPMKLKEIDKLEIWKMFCNIYQVYMFVIHNNISFIITRHHFYNVVKLFTVFLWSH